MSMQGGGISLPFGLLIDLLPFLIGEAFFQPGLFFFGIPEPADAGLLPHKDAADVRQVLITGESWEKYYFLFFS